MKRWLLIERVPQDIGDTIRQASFKDPRLAKIRQLELMSEGIESEIVEFDGFDSGTSDEERAA